MGPVCCRQTFPYRITAVRQLPIGWIYPVSDAERSAEATLRDLRKIHYSQVFCKYGAPAITGPGLQGIALKYS